MRVKRRAQKPVSIRSDRAAARLALLTRDGRSQARVIEEALDYFPLPREKDDLEASRARIDAITRRSARTGIPSMAEFDAREYDERGNPR